MGAGKSTIGKALAQALQRTFYDSDTEIEIRAGADIAWIFDIEGEEGFRKREQKVIEELTQKKSIVLATGGGTVITPQNRLFLASRGTVIYLKTSLEQQFHRTKRDAKRPLLKTSNVQQRLAELWEQRSPLYEEIADFSFETEDNNVKTITTAILECLRDNANYFH